MLPFILAPLSFTPTRPALLDGTWQAQDLQIGHLSGNVTCSTQEVSLFEESDGKLTGCTRYTQGCSAGLPWYYAPLSGLHDRKTGAIMLVESKLPKETWYQGSIKSGKLDLMLQRHPSCFWHFIEPQAGKSSLWNVCGESTPFTSPEDEYDHAHD